LCVVLRFAYSSSPDRKGPGLLLPVPESLEVSRQFSVEDTLTTKVHVRSRFGSPGGSFCVGVGTRTSESGGVPGILPGGVLPVGLPHPDPLRHNMPNVCSADQTLQGRSSPASVVSCSVVSDESRGDEPAQPCGGANPVTGDALKKNMGGLPFPTWKPDAHGVRCSVYLKHRRNDRNDGL
jgi:hypothetical protein